ncbi:MAG TPA: hypothetical protein VMU40_15540 [Steroidobacteraceae bacterium]|nr:hypothetical protein [Steroidobacteraceae bacterium]
MHKFVPGVGDSTMDVPFKPPQLAPRISLALSLAILACAARPAGAQQNQGFCNESLLAQIPARTAAAPSGSAFAQSVRTLSGTTRDQLTTSELMAGDVPEFLRHLVPVTVQRASGGRTASVTVCVLPDYLAVGSNTDFLFVPMGLRAALQVATRFGFVLPTPRLVDAIYAASSVKLDPQPLTPGAQMRSTPYVLYHTQLIKLQRQAWPAPLGALTSGDKKDLVLTERLWQFPGRVAIYGWHRAQGRPIQPLSTVHGARYADYSHGVRLVSRTAYVNGSARRIEDVLADPTLGPFLSGEGAMPHLAERLSKLIAELRAQNP